SRFLDEVQSHSNENKMSVQNLATVFGPNVLRPRMEDPVTMMESSQVQHLMTVLISEHSRLYQRDQPEPDAKTPVQPQNTPPVQRGKVEWMPQEDKDTPDSTTNEISQCATGMDSQSGDRCKKEDKVEDVSESKADGKGGSDLTVSPSKQSKPLPTWKSSLKGGAASGGPRGKIGGSAGDVSAAGGSNWLMNGLSSLRSHRRTTSSGERLKDSTLSLKDSDEDSRTNSSSLSQRALQTHRLSAYDNVAPSSLSLPADTSALWTSYEISLEEPKSSDNDVKVGQAKDKGTEVEDTENVGETIVSITVNEPEETEEEKQDGCNEAVSELKQELKNQRKNYETRIRLEESCTKYQLQVSRLEEELDQEKKKLHMLEIRLRNSERAHQDAEKRNVLLQKEMEDFFKTLGDLTTGTTRTN
uniref:Rho-GAP domain-containing protein n=1 Tax=Periophthalmus magnuspinnatus TaxID=409849 RepID=A0A3B4B9D8_9GOBI